jgi:hypothetical protein
MSLYGPLPGLFEPFGVQVALKGPGELDEIHLCLMIVQAVKEHALLHG